ncbi:hypothetical protein SSX86_032410 [Deinandra increscens subsp. villosa]|uniref:F-box domain-containing protein n=1 Tax=Deinandra increscens subsp. villosa TaxID=3103831 RepID=A0AAP0C3R0_9ASTR
MSSYAGDNLLPEITEAILSLLPAKTLGRLKSVSKTWDSLISNPQFVKTHLDQNHHKTPRKLILIPFDHSPFSLDVSEFLPSPRNSDDDISATGKGMNFPIMCRFIWGSCNGLVLAEDETDTNFFINPTTKEIWNVPPSPFALPITEGFDMMYGFGYDSSTDDYKVVSISYLDGPDLFVSVYSLGSNSWKKLRNYPFDGDLPNVVLVNENLNWLTSPRANGSPPTLLAFSLATEEFNKIELPSSGSIENDVPVLFAVGGKLGVFGAVQVVNESWVMEEYGVAGSWTRLGIDGLDTGCHNTHYYLFVEGINGDIVVQDQDIVVVYNMEERRCRKVRIEGGPRGFVIRGTYFESLESPAKCIARIH